MAESQSMTSAGVVAKALIDEHSDGCFPPTVSIVGIARLSSRSAIAAGVADARRQRGKCEKEEEGGRRGEVRRGSGERSR